MPDWTLKDIPPQTGKLAVITGATGGIGYETALALAQAGAEVLILGRNPAKGRTAIQNIARLVPSANLRFEEIDLASLASVRECATRILTRNRPIELLINNAGVMTPPKRMTTVDGFELQFATNHLSHFLLTAQLLPLLRRSPHPRVVNVSSSAARMGGSINFDDLQSQRTYKAFSVYAQSKLANLLFTFELQRLSDANHWNLISNAAHPGYARTDLVTNGPGDDAFLTRLSSILRPFMSQSAAAGALPTLFAATSPTARPSGYYSPKNCFELKGPVYPAHIPPKAKDLAVARRLWDISVQLTGAQWPTP